MSQNNLLIWAFIRSILIILGISITCGAGTGYITHNWLAGIIAFIVTTAIQFAANSIMLTYSDRRNKEADFLAQQVLKEASERELPFDLNCAYCNTLNRVGISFNDENTFTCTQCQQPNKVYLQFSVVRITTPLTPKEDVSKFIDIDGDTGITQSSVNEPIRMNEK